MEKRYFDSVIDCLKALAELDAVNPFVVKAAADGRMNDVIEDCYKTSCKISECADLVRDIANIRFSARIKV